MPRKPVNRINFAIGAAESLFLEVLDAPLENFVAGPIPNLIPEGQPIAQIANVNANANEPHPEQ